uniref:Uncharacterized protein n=1 Tax=Meloidogyne enterolobii TaxID=390850 RepID=A0A6V7UJW6_MELEN|nr:unnamed protein product [Meloidogyne enterolobii]
MAFLITPTIYLFVILINFLFINGEEMLMGGGGEEQFNNNNNGMGGMHPTHIPNIEENKMPKNDEKFVGEKTANKNDGRK